MNSEQDKRLEQYKHIVRHATATLIRVTEIDGADAMPRCEEFLAGLSDCRVRDKKDDPNDSGEAGQ